MKGFVIDTKEWLSETARIFRHEMSLVFSDIGVMLFFFFLPIAYPIVYSLIYNTEVTRDMPVAVVDNSRTAMSREFVRHDSPRNKGQPVLEVPAVLKRHIGQYQPGEQGLERREPDETADKQRRKPEHEPCLKIG